MVGRIAVNEFRSAWDEFFKGKKRPKSDAEDKKQQEEFMQWYNHVRKQSDTGKTPAVMYREIYRKEPPQVVMEDSRMMNHDWDEEYSENDDGVSEEEMEELRKDFGGLFWPKIRKETKDVSKKDACFLAFITGVVMMRESISIGMDEALKEMTPEKFEKIVREKKK